MASSTSSSSSSSSLSRLLSCLESSTSDRLYPSLVTLRSKYIKSPSHQAWLIRHGLVFSLVKLLERPNAKIVDISLSILGNLMLEDLPRKQIRDRQTNGLSILVGILRTINEESILSRVCRTLANLAQDEKNAQLLHQKDILSQLVKTLTTEVASPKTKQVIVRAIRVLSSTASQKRRAVDAQAVAAVARLLVDSGGGDSVDAVDEDLLKAVTKCLAHLTHGCSLAAATQVRGEDGHGFERLVKLMTHEERSVWEAAMACLVNLSHQDSLRPNLGNVGVVVALVDKMLSDTSHLTTKESAHCVTALCLYCRESVNRMKLREFGGLRLFVRLLDDPTNDSLHDRIVNSLLQFAYDERGLLVLQHYGVIPCLVKFVNAYVQKNRVVHDCAEEICQNDDDNDGDDKGLAKEEKKEGEKEDPAVEDEPMVEENVEAGEKGEASESVVVPAEPSSASASASASVSVSAQELSQTPDKMEEGELPASDDVPVSASEESNSAKQPEEAASVEVASAESHPARFRVNSPSYQAVQHEFEQFMRIRNEHAHPLSSSSAGPSRGSGGPFWSSSSDSPNSSLCHSPDQSPFAWSSSPGYSPCASSPAGSSVGEGSPFKLDSPDACPSPGGWTTAASEPPSPSPRPRYQNVPSPPLQSSVSPSIEEGEEEEGGEVTYSPVEQFSEEEEPTEEEPKQAEEKPKPTEEDEPKPSTSRGLPEEGQTNLSPPPAKRFRPNAPSFPQASPSGFKSIFSPTYEQSFNPFSLVYTPPTPAAALNSSAGADSGSYVPESPATLSAGLEQEKPRENNRIGWILQILSRMSQAEKLHDSLLDVETTKALIRYLCHIKDPLPRAGRILMRMSKNLCSIMAFVSQRHLSWIKLELDARPTLPVDATCPSCKNLFQLRAQVTQSASLLAETGYAEGQICHLLMRGSELEKKFAAVSVPMLVRPRKLLRNILLSHEGLEVILDILETDDGGTPNPPNLPESVDQALLFSHAVLGIHVLSCHVGIVAPNLTLEEKQRGKCHFRAKNSNVDLHFRLDDGSTLSANREIVSGASSVFAAMLSGQFVESGQNTIELPLTSRGALECLLHYLYGCRWCDTFDSLDVHALLELVSMSDKYLLSDFNQSVSHEIVQRCLRVDQVVSIYESGLQREYVIRGVEESLAACTVNYLLVGTMDHKIRVEIFRELLRSRLKNDFADDVSRLLRAKLLEVR